MIAAILASTSAGGIGNKGTLPWPKHKEDLLWFKGLTENNIVVMGRNTWDDPKLPKPLPSRINCVVTSKHIPGYTVRRINGDVNAQVLELQQQFPEKDVFIIGGKQLYESCIDIVDRVYLTRMKENWWCDTRVQLDRMLTTFRIKSVKPGTNCTYETWDRVLF